MWPKKFINRQFDEAVALNISLPSTTTLRGPRTFNPQVGDTNQSLIHRRFSQGAPLMHMRSDEATKFDPANRFHHVVSRHSFLKSAAAAKPPVPEAKLRPVEERKKAHHNSPEIKGLYENAGRICRGNNPTQLPTISEYGTLQLISETGIDMT